MKPQAGLLAIISLFFLLTSCSPKVPFTQAIRDQYKLTPEEMSRIQFYISDQVILRRGNESDKKSTEDGTLVIQSGNQIDQVVIKAETRGTADRIVDNQSLAVSFEDGAENYLVFSSAKNSRGYYLLQALNWNEGRGKVNYGGKTWYSSQGSENAFLMIKMKSIEELRVTEKVAKGKTVK